jgi:hypothetical protein
MAYNRQCIRSPGTTGFDAVGSWGWLRVEVPEASLNPGNNTSAKSHDFPLAYA